MTPLARRLLDAEIDYDPDVSSLDDLRALLHEARLAILLPDLDVTISTLARDVLGIPSLDEQGRDSLDFHEVSVVAVRAALAAAYIAGKQAPR